MKRLIIIAITLVCGAILSNNFAKKPAKQEVDPQQAYRDSVAMVEELQKLEEEMRIKKEMYELKKKAAREELNRSLMDEMEMLIPCQEEARSTDEYYGALGIYEGPSVNVAMMRARQNAQMELSAMVGDGFEDSYVENACQIMQRDPRGNYVVYIALRYPKNK